MLGGAGLGSIASLPTGCRLAGLERSGFHPGGSCPVGHPRGWIRSKPGTGEREKPSRPCVVRGASRQHAGKAAFVLSAESFHRGEELEFFESEFVVFHLNAFIPGAQRSRPGLVPVFDGARWMHRSPMATHDKRAPTPTGTVDKFKGGDRGRNNESGARAAPDFASDHRSIMWNEWSPIGVRGRGDQSSSNQRRYRPYADRG